MCSFIVSWHGPPDSTRVYSDSKLPDSLSLHWVLDVVFREDDSRHHAGKSGENLGLLRRRAISLLKQEKTSGASLKTKRLRCGWDDDYLAKGITSAGLDDA